MAKDPAFLFYYQDFLVGTDHMTDEQIGQYIKCLCHQANRGAIRVQHMKNICKTHDNHMIVSEKFKIGENGELFNERLRVEVDRRKAYSESRRKNKICSTYDEHMETETITEKETKELPTKRVSFKPPTIAEIEEYAKSISYPIDAEKFFDYYDGNDWFRGKTKIKKWEACVRTWKSNDNDKNKSQPKEHMLND